MVHNYRWGLALADGNPEVRRSGKGQASGPVITVPAITMEGDSNGAVHSDSSVYRNKFSGQV